jgi:hypothetical protein
MSIDLQKTEPGARLVEGYVAKASTGTVERPNKMQWGAFNMSGVFANMVMLSGVLFLPNTMLVAYVGHGRH